MVTIYLHSRLVRVLCLIKDRQSVSIHDTGGITQQQVSLSVLPLPIYVLCQDTGLHACLLPPWTYLDESVCGKASFVCVSFPEYLGIKGTQYAA